MDRQIVYPGQIPLETDLLNTNKNAMVALGKLAAAILGTSTFVNGLSVAATGPASMSVQVNPGEIYSLQNVDGTAYSSLAADTTHQIMKQGILLDAITLACPAPATAGQSINYLIQATYQDSDTGLVALPYYNASNPAQAYSGPNNTGTQQATARKGTVIVSAKAGTAATTGSQTTPAPDAGYVGLYVVTVANGQSTITGINISQAANAPVINSTLLGLSPAFQVSPTVPTPGLGDNSQKAINSAFLMNAFANSAGGNGYTKLPNGLILQWGSTGSIAASSTANITLPVAFTTAIYASLAGIGIPGSGTFNSQPLSLSQIQVQNTYAGNALSGYFIALGK